MRDVFLTFLRLGSTSFGGPVAHLGYFRREFVERRAWLDDDTFAALVAFCSVLPGPTSSQVGMLVGFMRAGGWGALFAWLGFTAPSAIALTALAFALGAIESRGPLTQSAWFTGLLAGLTAAAAAVVAQAVLALAGVLCTTRETRTIALGAAILAIATGSTTGLQWLPIALGALVGAVFLRRRGERITVPALPFTVPRAASLTCAALCVAFGAAVLVPVALPPALVLVATIARAGALVFGGGHVVLPLLQGLVADGLIPSRDFFAGYGAVQAMPGPIFTFATFLGAANLSPLHGIAGAAVATVAIFAPSFALIFALVPVWNAVRSAYIAAAALRGANAAVVGLLGGVLYHPIITSLESSTTQITIALGAFALVQVWNVAPWIVVLAAAAFGAVTGMLP